MTEPLDIGESYVGGEAKFYFNSATFDAPAWTEIINCGDLDVPDSRTKVAAPIRAQWPFVGKLSGAREIGLAWTSQQKKGANDTVTTTLLTAYDAGGTVEFCVADGDIDEAGTKYRRIGCIITKAADSEPLDGVVIWSFEADFSVNSPTKPSRATVA